jgi:hypothetical protein
MLAWLQMTAGEVVGWLGQTDVLLMARYGRPQFHLSARAALGEPGGRTELPVGACTDRSLRGGGRVAGLMTGLVAVGLVTTGAAVAQEHHAAGHPYYSNWVNQKGTGCCNNQDCGEIADSDVREDGNATEVRIDGEWCTVQSWMYLKAGNAPNWSANHVCVVPDSLTLADRRPCARLICFQPKPGT